MWIEKFPTHGSQSLFAFDIDSTRLVSLKIHPDGKLSFKSTAQAEPGLFPHAVITKARWTHISLVHYTHRSFNPTIRPYYTFYSREYAKPRPGLFIDGIFCDGLNWPYPKNPTTAAPASYVIGDDTSGATMRWCLSTAYLISSPLGQCHHMSSSIFSKIILKTTNYTVSYITWDQNTPQTFNRMN